MVFDDDDGAARRRGSQGTDLHDQLSAYALGVLDGADAARFEEHLTTCAQCSRELESFLSVVDVLSGVDADGLAGRSVSSGDTSFLRGMVDQVRAERIHARHRRIRLGCAVAAVALGIGILVVAPFGRTVSVAGACALFGVALLLLAWSVLASPPRRPISSVPAALTWLRATMSTLERLRDQALASAHPLLAVEIDAACHRVHRLAESEFDVAELLAEAPERTPDDWIATVNRAQTEIDSRGLRRRTMRARLAYRLNLPLGEEASINFAVSRTAEQFERMNREVLSRIPPPINPADGALDGSHV